MNVLVAIATRHGATMEIGRAIETTLREAGLETRLARVEDVQALEPSEAVVIGSGVYLGHWLRPARDFVRRHGPALRERAVWLFSSGPVGDPPTPAQDAPEPVDLMRELGAREYRSFAGRLDPSDLRLREKALVALVRAPEGDYRPWPEIRAWAASIAEQLKEPSSVEGSGTG
jgi:menaquinone-dependent protoporphyrinogen oxidase